MLGYDVRGLDRFNDSLNLLVCFNFCPDVSKEGLFRKPGNRQRMRNLRESLIESGSGVTIDTNVYNAHDVCGILKEFLRELPEPLLSERHMEAHMQIAGKSFHHKVMSSFWLLPVTSSS